MKDLKYIKLFEAFESEKISKTLGFIGKDAKKIFLSQLKDITKNIDMPISKLSDEYFKYLPFKKALDLKSEPEKVKCDQESSWIEGEFCEGGRIKRTWGTGFRSVECTNCKGTGFVTIGVGQIKYLKFWFTSDGKYVNTTAVDGVIRNQNNTNINTSFSTKKSDYDEVRRIDSLRDLRDSTVTGDILWASINSTRKVVMVYKYDGKTFFLQNSDTGTEPSDGGMWKKYGASQSWIIQSSSDYDSQFLILLKRKESDVAPESKHGDVDDDVAYSWNNIYNTRYNRVDNIKNVKETISNAHFAIVLDLVELKKSKFKKSSEISIERDSMRKGATKMIKDEQIKRENIERYIKALVDKFDIGEDISGITKVVPRVFGWANCANFIFKGVNINNFNSLITNIYRFMKVDAESKVYYMDNIKSQLTNIYKETSKQNKLFNDGISYIYDRLDKDLKNGQDHTEDIIKIFDLYLEFGEILQKKLINSEIKDISDLELVYQKLSSVRTIWRSDRLENLYNIRSMVEYIASSSPNHAYTYLKGVAESGTDISKVMSDLQIFKKIIEKI